MPWSRPTIPGIFKVPHSNLSGRKSGWVKREELLPVPPTKTDLASAFNLSSIIKPPIPWGPRRDLCPVNVKALKDKNINKIWSDFNWITYILIMLQLLFLNLKKF